MSTLGTWVRVRDDVHSARSLLQQQGESNRREKRADQQLVLASASRHAREELAQAFGNRHGYDMDPLRTPRVLVGTAHSSRLGVVCGSVVDILEPIQQYIDCRMHRSRFDQVAELVAVHSDCMDHHLLGMGCAQVVL